MALTEEQAKVIKELSILSKESSSYECMPVLIIWAEGEDYPD
jgi:hypothetical protein